MDSPYGECKQPKDRKRGAKKAKQEHSEAQIEREAKAHKRETKKPAAKPRKQPVVVEQSQVLVLGGASSAAATGEPTIVRSFSLSSSGS